MKNYIVIIGSGSYVIDDNYGNGVVLRSVLQANKLNFDNSFYVLMFYRSEEKKKLLEKKLEKIKYSDKVIIKDIKELDSIIKSNKVFASFIGVPDKSHYNYIKLCLSNAIPTWIVKPVTDDLEQALSLQNIENSNLLWIDYHKRFDQSNMFIKKLIKENTYGSLLHYSVQYTQPYDLPMETFSWTNESNVFSYIGCHYVDQLEFLFAKNIKDFVISSIGTKGKVYREYGDKCYDSVLSTLRLNLKNNQEIICSFQVGWNDPKGTPSKSHQRVELTFENGRVIMDQKERGVEIWDENKLQHVNPYFFTEYYDSFYDETLFVGYGYDSIKYFLEFAKGEKFSVNENLPFLNNILFSEYVLDASKKSLDEAGKWIGKELNE